MNYDLELPTFALVMLTLVLIIFTTVSLLLIAAVFVTGDPVTLLPGLFVGGIVAFWTYFILNTSAMQIESLKSSGQGI